MVCQTVWPSCGLLPNVPFRHSLQQGMFERLSWAVPASWAISTCTTSSALIKYLKKHCWNKVLAHTTYFFMSVLFWVFYFFLFFLLKAFLLLQTFIPCYFALHFCMRNPSGQPLPFLLTHVLLLTHRNSGFMITCCWSLVKVLRQMSWLNCCMYSL